jgi:hypothetical protein
VWIQRAELRVGYRLASVQPKHQLEQPCHPCRLLSVSDMRLCATNWQLRVLSARETSSTHKRAYFNRVTKRRTRSMCLAERENIRIHARVLQNSNQEALLRLATRRGEARRAAILPDQAAEGTDNL